MNELMSFFRIDKIRLVKPLTAAYAFVAVIEIIAELNRDMSIILLSKPLLMPLLIGLYWSNSKKANHMFIFSLIAVWIANVFLISDSMNLIFAGSIFFLLYRLIVMYLVFRVTKFPGYLPMIVGCMPFLFLYLFVTNLTHQELGERFLLFVLQGGLMILFGGFCIGNYILKSNRANTYLLISTLLFTAAQFLIVVKLFYHSYTIFQPLSMLFFVLGQYLLYQFIILAEKKRRRYHSMATKKD